jgi:hypothetical protein
MASGMLPPIKLQTSPGNDHAMLSTLMPLLILMLLAWAWLDGARAREFATALVRRHCENQGLQFLDETVALARMGLRWTRDGLRLRRMFRFEFSLEGAGRHTGYILMMGMHLEGIDDGLAVEPVEEPEHTGQAPVQDDNNVVPFKRRKE